MKVTKIIITSFLLGLITCVSVYDYAYSKHNHNNSNDSVSTKVELQKTYSESKNINLLGEISNTNKKAQNIKLQINEKDNLNENSNEKQQSTVDENDEIIDLIQQGIIEDNNSPIEVQAMKSENIKYDIYSNNNKIKSYESEQVFPLNYTDIEGVITFRGNNLRNSPAFGTANIVDKKLEHAWSLTTGSSTWGGGAGWTGQPSIIKWPDDVKKIMNIKEKFKNDEEFVEVIYASLDGRIYFIDLKTGEKTREPINIKNPIKGSVALDPRGYPILYVGQGINETGKIGYRIFSLIDGSLMYFLNGRDSKAYRGWGAFDGAPVINKDTDTMILGGENGLFYNVKLNTQLDIENKKISINPEIVKYAYKVKDNYYQGIENSAAVYKNLAYFADNGGTIQCVDIQTMNPVWIFDGTDDIDATLTLEVENEVPYVYAANEVDKQGKKGITYLRKINGLTGELVFEKPYEAMSQIGDHPVNGGVLATSVIGKNNINNLVIFTIARYKKFHSGLMVALDKSTGEEVWRFEMPQYGWSSPVDIYDEEGNGYIIQCDSIGTIHLIEGKTGKVLDKIKVNNNIESSPAVYNDTLVVAERYGKIYGVKIH